MKTPARRSPPCCCSFVGQTRQKQNKKHHPRSLRFKNSAFSAPPGARTLDTLIKNFGHYIMINIVSYKMLMLLIYLKKFVLQSILQFKTAYAIIAIGKGYGVMHWLISSENPKGYEHLGFSIPFRAGLLLRLITVRHLIKPFAKIIGSYLCHNRCNKGYDFLHWLTPFLKPGIGR